jgi:hypothetical protein
MTLYNRFVRWSRAGVFDWIFATLAAECAAINTMMRPSREFLRNRLSGNGNGPSQRALNRGDFA